MGGFSHALRPSVDLRRHRFNNETIARETQRSGGAFAVELHAPAGSVICFDSGSIHHGKRLVEGTRTGATLFFGDERTLSKPLSITARKAFRSVGNTGEKAQPHTANA